METLNLKRKELSLELNWLFNPIANIGRLRFLSYRNRHLGERCFILGNGPSLKLMDLSILEHENTFGLNRIYLLFPKLGFTTTYYVSVNRLVIQQTTEDIQSIDIPKFLNWHARDLLNFDKNTCYVRDNYDHSEGFAKIPLFRVWEGATVTYVALQLAFFMGFSKVILIGVDHTFKTKGEPHSIFTSKGDDYDHFDKSYFGRGFRWQLPDLITSEKFYSLARKVYEENGREIFDATVDGKLEVFPKLDFSELI